MGKRIIALFLIVITVAALAGCAGTPVEPQVEQLNPDIPDGVLGFETVFACYETGLIGGDRYDDLYESRVRMYYLREKLTDTMYVWRTSGKQGGTGGYSYWSSGMTAMLDPATGGPLTYDAFLQYIEGMTIRCSKCNREFDEPISYCPDCGSMITVSED